MLLVASRVASRLNTSVSIRKSTKVEESEGASSVEYSYKIVEDNVGRGGREANDEPPKSPSGDGYRSCARTAALPNNTGS